jgi:hypothetical protein
MQEEQDRQQAGMEDARRRQESQHREQCTLISQMQSFTGATENECRYCFSRNVSAANILARFYLDSHEWNLEASVKAYYEANR